MKCPLEEGEEKSGQAVWITTGLYESSIPSALGNGFCSRAGSQKPPGYTSTDRGPPTRM